MAKELPYFKFYPGEWLTGDITMCSEVAQFVFINLICFYWQKDSICLANVKQRFSKYETEIKELINNRIIKIDDCENVIINFLDEQKSNFINISEKRIKSGKAGGKANAKQMPSKCQYIREDKKREEKIIKDKNIFIIPSIQEIKNYCIERKNNVDAEKFFNFYESKGWLIGKNKMKDWRAAVRTWETKEIKPTLVTNGLTYR